MTMRNSSRLWNARTLRSSGTFGRAALPFAFGGLPWAFAAFCLVTVPALASGVAHPVAHPASAKSHAAATKAHAEPVAHSLSNEDRKQKALPAKGKLAPLTAAGTSRGTHAGAVARVQGDEPATRGTAQSSSTSRQGRGTSRSAGRSADEDAAPGKAAPRHGKGNAREADADEPPAKAGKGVRGSAAGSANSTSKKKQNGSVEGDKRSGRRRSPAQEAPEIDPPVLYRASTKAGAGRSDSHVISHESLRTPSRPAPPDRIVPRVAAAPVVKSDEAENEAAPAETPSAFAEGEVRGHHQRRPGPAAAAAGKGVGSSTAPTPSGGTETGGNAAHTQATNEDFLRAAGIARTPPVRAGANGSAPAALEPGESPPAAAVRVAMTVPAAKAPIGPLAAAAPLRRLVPKVSPATTPAIVTAAPAPVTPLGTPTLPEKLHSLAVKADTAVYIDAVVAKAATTKKSFGKVSILPDDLADKDAVIEEAMTPMVLPNLYSAGGRLLVPPPMKGSRDILLHQNTMADSDGLSRIQDDDDLNRMRAAHLLVPIPESNFLQVNSDLPANRRYARPWTERFVEDTAHAFYAQFKQPLRLNSAVRTVAYQVRLQRVNGNAAAAEGDWASPHLTGQAIDFGKRGLTVTQIAWMRAYLGPIMDSGKIDVEEEFQQACFHISVYKAYAPAAKTKPRAADLEVAQVHAAPIVRRAPKPDKPDKPGPDDENDVEE